MYLQNKKMVIRDIKTIKKKGASKDLIEALNHLVLKSQFFRDQAKKENSLSCRSYLRALNILSLIIDMISFWRRSN